MKKSRAGITKSVSPMRAQKSFIRSPSETQSEVVAKVAKAWDITTSRLRMMLLLL